MDAHQTAIAKISKQVSTFHARQTPFRIYHGSTNSTRPSPYRRDAIVSTSNLTHILSLDSAARTILVEPNVPMDALVAATLPHGLVPPVVMEFPGITAGGGFSGTSGESSSFRHGFFGRGVNWVEVVLGNGEVVRASRGERTDLFWGAASGCGTLGVVTVLELGLVRARRYVELSYHRCGSMSGARGLFEKLMRDDGVDYVDGIAFAKDWVVVCAGRLTDDVTTGTALRRFSRRGDPWFYLHAKKRTRHLGADAQPPADAVPIVDYLFRYDRGGFWVGRYAFRYFAVTPFDCFSRWLMDTYMHTRVLYHALHKSGLANRYIVQDVAVPLEETAAFADWLHDNFGRYPLWVCPLRLGGDSGQELMVGEAGEAVPEYLMNFGVWGAGPKHRKKFVDANRALEKRVLELGGKKWLYAHAFYTEDEFWAIHDRRAYDALREKYYAGVPAEYLSEG